MTDENQRTIVDELHVFRGLIYLKTGLLAEFDSVTFGDGYGGACANSVLTLYSLPQGVTRIRLATLPVHYHHGKWHSEGCSTEHLHRLILQAGGGT